MTTVIIVAGLTPDNFSPSAQFTTNPNNLGRQEIERLIGVGRSAGAGPLVRFIKAATALAAKEPDGTQLIFIQDRQESGGSPNHAIIEEVRQEAQSAELIEADPGTIPWRPILGAASVPVSPDIGDRANAPLRAMIVGAHTELRIGTIATALKGLFDFDSVAVCSHLVGSATREAHFAALRYGLPAVGVEVLLDLSEAANYVGLDSDDMSGADLGPCSLGPPEVIGELDDDARRVVERICMHWSSATLRSLTGGFSGSLLFIAEGRQGNARTEPMVIKIDRTEQMLRELGGYYRVRDLVGKHVPAFGFPVAGPGSIGVGMELAAMEGAPETLQDMFEGAQGDDSSNAFQIRFAKTLRVLTDRLYRNTSREEWIVPYREFQMHSGEQVTWLGENIANIAEKGKEENIPGLSTDSTQLQTMLRLVGSNENGLTSAVCLSHGDLNYQNIISDEAGNLWFIDWTHAGDYPLTLDFAKLENDVKFVMSKDFSAEDLPRLRQFEEYLLDNAELVPAEDLPDSLSFVKWDLRYRKMLDTVRQIRSACFDLLPGDTWLIYRIALLRYATHTLSFDEWSGRGECGLVALLHALQSVESLLYQLVADDFHLRIRIEKPDAYPDRLVILIDEAPWSVDCDRYKPPYFVAPEVLDAAKADDPMAHPEDYDNAASTVDAGRSDNSDDHGKPLNPRGRTGIAGRGLLRRWGANPAVAAVVVRRVADDEGLEFLVGKLTDRLGASLPRDLLAMGESQHDGLRRVMRRIAGLDLPESGATKIYDDFSYDFRQTDHAWVELEAWLVGPDDRFASAMTGSTDRFDETDWWPLEVDSINQLDAADAKLVNAAIDALQVTPKNPEATGIIAQ